jgi:hypothetical protein
VTEDRTWLDPSRVIVMAASPQPIPKPSGGPADAAQAPGPPERGIGLVSATGLVIGSIIGIGVFTMPAVLASVGTSSPLVLAVVAVGAVLLARDRSRSADGEATSSQRAPITTSALPAFTTIAFTDG